MEVRLKRFHFNGRAMKVYSQTQKLKVIIMLVK